MHLGARYHRTNYHRPYRSVFITLSDAYHGIRSLQATAMFVRKNQSARHLDTPTRLLTITSRRECTLLLSTVGPIHLNNQTCASNCFYISTCYKETRPTPTQSCTLATIVKATPFARNIITNLHIHIFAICSVTKATRMYAVAPPFPSS